MINPRDIVIAPVISEKSQLALAQRKYYFRVLRDATKTDIARSVKSIFNVDVTNVNIVTMKSKRKRLGRFAGKTSSWKKAIVTIKKDQKITSFFEGM